MELILNTYGTSINRENDGFIVSTKEGKQRIPVDSVKSIQVNKGVQITSDAIFLAIEHEIDIIFVEKSGNPKGRVWSNKYGSISTIRKGQIEFTFSHQAVAWIKDIIIEKIKQQQAILLMFIPQDTVKERIINRSIGKLQDYIQKIKQLDGEIVNDIAAKLRGWEGQASKIYFLAINEVLPEKYRFISRSQKPAMDIANAMLNYGYGILYGKIEGALIKAGIDPYVGILHRDDYNRPVLVYDVIEKYRMWVEYIVFTLLCQDVVNEDYFSIREDGSFWLENLGRRVLIQAINDYLDEVVLIKGLNRSRLQQIHLYAQSLAQIFKNF